MFFDIPGRGKFCTVMKMITSLIITAIFILFVFPPVLYASEIFSVQAGAFSSKNNAQNIINILQDKRIQCTIYDEKRLYKVYCGEFIRKSEANALRRKISSIGYDAFVIPKTIKAPQDIPKDISAEQPEEPVLVEQSTEQRTETCQSEETETEQTISPPVTSMTKVAAPTEDKNEPKAREQKQEVISPPQAPVLLNRVVAVVNKEVITWSELYRAMEFEAGTQIENLSAEERKKLFKRSEASFLESLIDARLQLQRAEELGLETTPREVTEAVDTVKKKYSMTQADFMGTLKKEGLTFEGYKKRLSEEILINKVVAREIRNKIVVSDDEVMKFIEDHKVNFRGNVNYGLRQIFLRKPVDGDKKTVEGKAALIIKRLRDGEDFSALAWVYSDDPSRKIGGDLGLVSRDLLAKEFAEVLSSMKVGDYSAPFWTEKGLHIIKLEDIVSAANADAVRDDVRKKLAEERFTKRYKSWVKDLREKAYVELRL
jgi:peptidyl-prolyl cis-trans isomerase SurA